MGRGGQLHGVDSDDAKRERLLTVEEVEQHHAKSSAPWIVIHSKVYDITRWRESHPGGNVLTQWAGQDASAPYEAFHPQLAKTSKFLKALPIVGELRTETTAAATKRRKNAVADGASEQKSGVHVATNKKESLVIDDEERELSSFDAQLMANEFDELRETLKKEGLFKANYLFYLAHFAHIVALEAIAYYFLSSVGASWWSLLITGVIMATAQAQAGWSQHDYGHSSVFPSSRMNRAAHHIVIGLMKGASSSWWNSRHFTHHSKPNVLATDPDINMGSIFVLGERVPKIYGKKKRGVMPYRIQHLYWHAIMPPLLLPTFFHYENIYHCVTNKKWTDLFFISAFLIRIHYAYAPLVGGYLNAFLFYLFFRMLESHWFVWVTQMNHIPMLVDFDKYNHWVPLQLRATCNVDQSFFNDWFSGHLNFQIEHHLFPTMPRHNYHKAASRVRALCEKHGLPYVSKPLFQAFRDIVHSLEKSGQMYMDAYLER